MGYTNERLVFESIYFDNERYSSNMAYRFLGAEEKTYLNLNKHIILPLKTSYSDRLDYIYTKLKKQFTR